MPVKKKFVYQTGARALNASDDFQGEKFLINLGVFVGVILVLWGSTYLMTLENTPKLLLGILALLAGIGGIWGLFYSLNGMVESLAQKARNQFLPWVFVGPAVAFLGFYIVFPVIRTALDSFFVYTSATDGWAEFTLDNYKRLFVDPKLWIALRNNLIWLLTVPTLTVSLGVTIAVLIDRIPWEKQAKAFIFMPMAISFVGAAVIWRFVYFYSTYGEQIGLLNALVVFFGGEPQGWFILQPWNNFFLIAIMIWLQTGFAVVVFSAAIKAVPLSMIEAAKIDGASEFTVFFRIIIPIIGGTILTVTTTMVTIVLKIFDIIFVMTSGNYNTDVIANMMYNQMFRRGNFGYSAAIAILIFIGVIPILIYNIRSLNRRTS